MFRAQYIIVRSGEAATRRLWGAGEARVRTIWAYLLGMMELARTEKTNHPGLLVFDEPRQQSAQNVTFRELLKRAATSFLHRQQVIFFTSEDPHQLETGLAGLNHTLINFDGRLLHPVPEP